MTGRTSSAAPAVDTRARRRRNLIIAIALPIILGIAYLAGMSTADARSGAIPALIVNEDQMATQQNADGSTTEVVAGRLLVTHLTSPDQSYGFTWDLADAQTAADALRTGRANVVVTIPENFSAAIASLGTNSPQQAQLQITTDQAHSYLSSQTSQALADAVVAGFGTDVTEQVAIGLVLGMDATGESLQLAADGSGQIATGADQLAEGFEQYTAGQQEITDGLEESADGAQQLADGIGEFVPGVDQFAEGTADYANGVSDFANGVTNYTAGVNEFAGGVPQFTDGVSEFGGQVADFGAQPQTDSIAASANVVDNTAQSIADLSSASTPPSADNTAAVDAAIAAAVALCTTEEPGEGEEAPPVDPALAAWCADHAPGLSEAWTEVEGFATDPTHDSLSNDLSNAANTLKAEAATIASDAGVLDTTISGLAAGGGSLAGQADAVAAGADRLTTGSANLDNAANQVINASTQISTGATQLQGGGSSLSQGMIDLADGLGLLSDGQIELTEGNEQIQTGIEDIGAGATELQSGLQAGADQATGALGDAESYAGVLARPVAATVDSRHDPQFGGTLAALALPIAAWIAGFVTSLIRRFLTPEALDSTASTARLVAMSLVRVGVPVLAVTVGVGFVAHVVGAPWVGLLGTLTLGVFLAAAITGLHVLFVAIWGRNGGAIASLVAFVIQLATLRGLLPNNLYAGWMEVIATVSPLSHAAAGLRLIYAGGSGGGIAMAYIALGLIALIAIGAAWLVIERKRRTSLGDIVNLSKAAPAPAERQLEQV